MEIWKDVPQHVGFYQVSNLGNLRSLPRKVKCKADNTRACSGKLIKYKPDKDGYFIYNFKKNGVRCDLKIHRVIAEVFLENPENKPFVNHKNGIKSDNRVENLEWVTPSENLEHAKALGLYNGRKPRAVIQSTIENEFIKRWNNSKEAAEAFGTNLSTLRAVCWANRCHKNFLWRYE